MMVKFRARLSWGPKDDKKVTLLNGIIELKTDGVATARQSAEIPINLHEASIFGTRLATLTNCSEASGKEDELSNIWSLGAIEKSGTLFSRQPKVDATVHRTGTSVED
eukprot:2650350-Amphidinium_carterae.1